MRQLIRFENVSRADLARKICRLIDREQMVSLKDLNRFKHGNDEHKNGLYAIYNRYKEILYIGKVGDGMTSAYNRILSHKNRAEWVDKEGFFRFCEFESLQDEQLAIAERLAIQFFHAPCNDKVTMQDKIDCWQWAL